MGRKSSQRSETCRTYFVRTHISCIWKIIRMGGSHLQEARLPSGLTYPTVFKDVCLVPRHCSHLSSHKLTIIRKSASQIERICRVLDNFRLQHDREFKYPWASERQISKLTWRNRTRIRNRYHGYCRLSDIQVQ
jgi:hypothetical protein